ncbi:hypothetical protein EDD22DRAFT_843728 [Suillus occidentalis]|nr:hypothetical protein EDD22DRAFT_843728 [Suillus occidentalis]
MAWLVVWIEHAAAALLRGLLFLHFGLDEYLCLAQQYTTASSTVLRRNSNGKYYPMFTAKEYGPIYTKMDQMLKDILQDPYHGPKLLVQLQEWAEAGWQELSQTPRSNPKFNPTIPLAPTTRVIHVEDDDEEVFYDCVD